MIKINLIIGLAAISSTLLLSGCATPSSESDSSFYYGTRHIVLPPASLKSGFTLSSYSDSMSSGEELESTRTIVDDNGKEYLTLPVKTTVEHTTLVKVQSNGKCVVEVSDSDANGVQTIKKFPFPCKVNKSTGVVDIKATTLDLKTGELYAGQKLTENQLAFP